MVCIIATNFTLSWWLFCLFVYIIPQHFAKCDKVMAMVKTWFRLKGYGNLCYVSWRKHDKTRVRSQRKFWVTDDISSVMEHSWRGKWTCDSFIYLFTLFVHFFLFIYLSNISKRQNKNKVIKGGKKQDEQNTKSRSSRTYGSPSPCELIDCW